MAATADRARAVGEGNLTYAIIADQPANRGIATDRAGAIGVVDLAIVVTADQPAGIGATAADRAGVVDVGEGATITADQPADAIITTDRTRIVGVGDAGFVSHTGQRTDIVTTCHCAARQANIAQGVALRPAKQADVIRSRPVDGQAAEGVAQSVKIPGECVPVSPHRVETCPGIPTGRGAGIDVAAQRVVKVGIALHPLQSLTRTVVFYP
jgi:hypothetical protein